MIRHLVILSLLTVCVGRAVATSGPLMPGARTGSLAASGLLIEDVATDHVWPASLAYRDAMIALRLKNRLEGAGTRSNAAALELRRRILGAMAQARIPERRGDLGYGVTLARSWDPASGAVAAGLSWESEPCGGDDMNMLRVGLRSELGTAAWIEAVAGRGKDDPNGWVVRDDPREWRVRASAEIRPGVLLVAAVEDLDGGFIRSVILIDPFVGHHDVIVARRREEIGLLLWPDADVQLLGALVRRIEDRQPSTESGDPTVSHEGEGLRVSCEIRPSAWWTWRLGFESLVVAAGDRSLSGRFQRLGFGLGLHFGDVDVGVAWTRVDRPGVRPHTEARMDVTSWF